MPDRDAILFANEAFYLAILHRDVKAMDQLWAQGVPVACLHPGWGALLGREEVLDSWRRILSHDTAPKIVCRQPEVLVHGDIAVVVCYGDIEGQLLVAPTLFRREGPGGPVIRHPAGQRA